MTSKLPTGTEVGRCWKDLGAGDVDTDPFLRLRRRIERPDSAVDCFGISKIGSELSQGQYSELYRMENCTL